MLTRWGAVIPTVIVGLILGEDAALAQETRAGSVTGIVTDAVTGEPVELVNVYLAYTTVGTSTDVHGRFVLKVPQAGSYDLVFSVVGHRTVRERIEVRPGDTLTIEERLEPVLIETPAVEINAAPDLEWEKSLRQFRRIILGTSAFSDRCALLNPEVLRFETQGDTLLASGDRPLVVENGALGYRLTVLIVDFAWSLGKDYGRFVIYPLFREMTPGEVDDSNEWEANRRRAYRGSIPHFFRSLIVNSSGDEKFDISTGPLIQLQNGEGRRVTDGDFLIDPVEGLQAFAVSFPGYIRVEYNGDPGQTVAQLENRYRSDALSRTLHPPPRISIIRMTGASVVVDSSGHLFDPLSLELAGDWALRRLDYLLPRN